MLQVALCCAQWCAPNYGRNILMKARDMEVSKVRNCSCFKKRKRRHPVFIVLACVITLNTKRTGIFIAPCIHHHKICFLLV